MRDLFSRLVSPLSAIWQQLTDPPTRPILFFIFVGVALLIIAAWRLRTRRPALAALCLFLAVVPHAVEVILATGLTEPQAPFWSIDQASPVHKREMADLARRFGVDMDTRDRFSLIANFHAQHIDAVPSVMVGDLLTSDGFLKSNTSVNHGQLLPLGGVSNAVTVLCNESGQYVTYRSDEHGFRNPKGIWNIHRADIAAVGESTVSGYCVADGKGFVDMLREHFPATLNLGTSGESSVLQLAAIKEYLPSYAPRVVLWVFSEGVDLPDLYDETTHPMVMRYLEPAFSQGLLGRQPEIDSALKMYIAGKEMRDRRKRSAAMEPSPLARPLGMIKLWDLREKLDLIYGANRNHEKGLSMLESAGQHLFSRTLAEAQTLTRSWGGTLYFVYVPSWSRYVDGANRAERERTRVLQRVQALGIPIIDVEQAFHAYHDPLSLFWFRGSGHFNDAGNHIVTDTVLKSLLAPNPAKEGAHSVDIAHSGAARVRDR